METRRREFDHSLISDTRAFLVSAPKGVSINRFDKDYRSLFGRPFPYRSYGFNNTFQLLRALEEKGVLKIEKSHNPRDGGWVMYGIPDTNNYLPSWFKKAHDKHCGVSLSSNNNGSRSFSNNSTAGLGTRFDTREDECRTILPDVGGTYSLYVQWKSCKNIDTIREVLYDLMSKVGEPVKLVCVPDKNYAFVRFSRCKQAEDALSQLDNTTVDQITFRIRPAAPLKYEKTQTSSFSNTTTHERCPFPPLPSNFVNPLRRNTSDSICERIIPEGYSPRNDSLALSVDNEDSSSCDLSDSEWDLLLSSSSTVTKSIDTHHWSTFVAQCSGGVSWRDRVQYICDRNVSVQLIASDDAIHGCTHWLQVLDSYEMQCLKRLSKYARITCIYSMLSTLPDQCSDTVYCYINGGELSRCLVLDKGGVVMSKGGVASTSQVFNIDTGEIVNISIASLMTPPKWLMEFPMLAMPCYLQNSSSTKCYIGRAHVSCTDNQIPLPLTVQLITDDNGPPPLINSSSSPSPTYPTSSPLTPDPSSSSYYSPSIDDNTLLQWKFNDTPNQNGLIAVHVSEVVSPSLFWVQVTDDPSEDMQWMSDMINNEMSTQPATDSRIHVHVSIGNVYAYKNGPSCCRVRVESFLDYEKQQTSVVCIDNGVKFDHVCIKSLHTLSLSLTSKPPLAVPCCISRIASTREDTLWFALDSQLLWRTIRNLTVYLKYPPALTPSRWSSIRCGDQPSLLPLDDVFLDSQGNQSIADIMMEEGTFVAMKKNQ